MSLNPQIAIRSGGLGEGVHVLLGLPTILVHECWPASGCSTGTGAPPPSSSAGTTAAEILCTAGYRHPSGSGLLPATVPDTVAEPLLPASKTHCGIGSASFWRRTSPGYTGYKISTVNPDYVWVTVFGLTNHEEPASDQANAIVNVPTRTVLALWETLGCTGTNGRGLGNVPVAVLDGFGAKECVPTAQVSALRRK